jgi:heme-degrading monooxygenase HmoA
VREESTKMSMEVFNKPDGKIKGMKGFLVILLP